MNVSQKLAILIQKSIYQRSMVHEGCWVNCLTRVGNLKPSTVCWRESARRVPLSGYQAAVDGVQRIAVEDLVFSHEDKPKRRRSAHEFLHETAILRSSVHRIIYRDLQLKCFKRCRVQLLSEANRISHLTRWKQLCRLH